MVKTSGTNGLDIQRDYICVAQYSPQDMAVRQIAVQPFSSESPGDFWDAVSLELSGLRKKIKFAGADVVCSVPCDMVVVRALEAESDELDQNEVLRFELGVGLLGGIGDYAYDFYEVDPGNMADLRRYLAAALRKETLAKLKKAVKKSTKLNPYIVDVDIFALTHAFQANYRDVFTGAAMLVLGEHRRTKLILVSNTSYIDYGIVEYDVDEHGIGGYPAALSAEVSRIVTDNAPFLRGNTAPVYLAGGLFADSVIVSKVNSAVPRSEMLNPFRKIQCAAGMDASQIEANACRLAVSVGLALRGEEGL
jgi:Tfp pilus assembly PilM family ATPase